MPIGTVILCASWPKGRCARKGVGDAAPFSRKTSSTVSVGFAGSLISQSVNWPAEDPFDLLEDLCIAQLGHHPVDPVRFLPDVLHEKKGVLEGRLVDGSHDRGQMGQIAAQKPSRPLALPDGQGGVSAGTTAPAFFGEVRSRQNSSSV